MVFHSLTLAFVNYFIIGYAYARGFDMVTFLSGTMTLVLFFLICASMAILVAYISELHTKMA